MGSAITITKRALASSPRVPDPDLEIWEKSRETEKGAAARGLWTVPKDMVQQSWCHCSATLDTVETNAKFQEEKLRVMSSGIFHLANNSTAGLELATMHQLRGAFSKCATNRGLQNFRVAFPTPFIKRVDFQFSSLRTMPAGTKLAGLHNLMWDLSIKGKDERAAATRPTDQCSLDTPLGPATTACSESRSSKATHCVEAPPAGTQGLALRQTAPSPQCYWQLCWPAPTIQQYSCVCLGGCIQRAAKQIGNSQRL